jgi:CRISPR-associated protein Csb2
MRNLCITFRFLQPYSHGRGDGGEPEWPPSPLRLYQAIVAAAAARWNDRIRLDYAVPALRWIATLAAPDIASCFARVSNVSTQFYVPDNTADLLVPAWKRGETDKAPKRTEKVVRPVYLAGDAVHYLYSLPDGGCPHFDILKAAARSVTHLGWGIDMVAADATILSPAEAAALPGERWRPTSSGGVPLRVPTDRTLDDLIRKHHDFLHRLGPDGFRPVPPLREFRVVAYRRTTDPIVRPHCVFSILKPDASGSRAFHTARRARDVAAWARHAVGVACAHWPDVASFVHGHGPDGKQLAGPDADRRLQFLPLPTINHALNRVEAIRRVLVAAPPGFEDRIAEVRRRSIGQELRFKDEVFGILNLQAGRDWVREQYLGEARVWSTVTPVILTGYDDRNPAKTRKLIAKALADSGIETDVDFDWQPFGFRAGVDPVQAFARPDHLNGTMAHVRLTFKQPVRGPLVLGAGRYRGFGLLAIER